MKVFALFIALQISAISSFAIGKSLKEKMIENYITCLLLIQLRTVLTRKLIMKYCSICTLGIKKLKSKVIFMYK